MKLIRNFFKIKVYLWMMVTLLLTVLIALSYGYLSGHSKQQSDRTVSSTIQYVEKVNEVVFLTTGIETVVTEKNYTEFFGQKLPFTEKSALIILRYKAKFGIKEPVKIEKVDINHYRVTIPSLTVIGFEFAENPYTLYDKSGEILSVMTSDIDTAELLTDQFQTIEQEKVLKNYTEDIKESAISYYKNLFEAISPDMTLDISFSN
ncbi:DUF4230 domain-containing protein [Streptococcus suis]|uniref:DUF4230 domain-containing protein n=1 Tax=Streptococcus parasuis TaxID=1501662 RepID=UPI001556B065|nr:DUF4230 domain-containing protein [Streptococcus suis]NQM54313.1 DUF4230 domain-containing protein [Streptococcus suis]WNF86650.1 DUF4230 domain-containing protein [Streptococcus parasuis]